MNAPVIPPIRAAIGVIGAEMRAPETSVVRVCDVAMTLALDRLVVIITRMMPAMLGRIMFGMV